MPTYEYSCTACGHHLEVVQSFTDASLTECPNCGGQLRKVFGNIGIVLKGSGFYKTDSRPSGGAKKNGRDGGSETSAPSTGDKAAGASGSSDTGGSAGPSTGDSGGDKGKGKDKSGSGSGGSSTGTSSSSSSSKAASAT